MSFHRHLRGTLVTLGLLAICVTAGATRAAGQTVHVRDDTNINLAMPTQVNGIANSLFVRNIGSGGERHTYLQFELSSVPSGVPINRASLRIWVLAVNDPGPVDIYVVAGPWNEETLSASVTPPLGVLIGTVNVTMSDQNRYVLADVTGTVQGWLNGTTPNHGIALVPTPADPVRITLDSKEATTTSHGPELEVALIPTGDITAVAAGTGLTGGGTIDAVSLSLDTLYTDARYAAAVHGHDVSQITNAATRGSNLFNGSQDVFGRVFANQSALPTSLIGQHSAASGQSTGVAGISNSTSGIGVIASAGATSGSTTGLLSYVDSAAGIAAVFENRAGGELIRGTAVEGALRFRVDGAGAVYAAGYRDLAGNPIPAGTGDITAVGVATGLTGGGTTGDVSLALDTTFTDVRYAAAIHGHDVSQVTNAASRGANTFTGTQTIDVGNLDLDGSTATSGNIIKNGSPFLTNFGTDNVFLGAQAGNLTMTGIANAAVGARALRDNTTGSNNTAVGMNALFHTTTGQGNTAVGTNTLANNLGGQGNTAIGSFALIANTSGGVNTAVGSSAMRANTTGSRNTATGDGALDANLSGSDNTASGHAALTRNTNGNRNTASGYQAMFFNTVGVGNTATGADALQNNAGSNNVALGNLAGFNATTGSNNIYVGANVLGVAGESDAMYLGSTQAKTVVAGIRGTTVTNGEMVVIDASGRLGTAAVATGADTVGSAQVIDESLTASDLAANSVSSSELAPGSVTADKVAFNYAGSTSAGGPAMDVSCLGCVGASEVGFTFAVLGANTFTATQTIDTGNLDLDASTATTGNITKNGTRFLHTFGTNNTFVGATAGNFFMTGAGANTATGFSTLSGLTTGTNNTASGAAALQANTEGSVNTAMGAVSLQFNSTGDQNTATGHAALNQNTTGSFNVGVGTNAGFSATTGSNNIYLGAWVMGVAGESNTMYLGRQGTQSKAFIAGVRGITTVNPDAIPVMIDSAGQLGTVSSSRRFKEEIRDMADASRRLFELRPVTFRYRQAYGDGSKPIQYGLVAEEVGEAFPELAVRNAAGDVETVHYETLSVLLLNELQKQQKEMQRQRERIDTLERRLSELLGRR